MVFEHPLSYQSKIATQHLGKGHLLFRAFGKWKVALEWEVGEAVELNFVIGWCLCQFYLSSHSKIMSEALQSEIHFEVREHQLVEDVLPCCVYEI